MVKLSKFHMVRLFWKTLGSFLFFLTFYLKMDKKKGFKIEMLFYCFSLTFYLKFDRFKKRKRGIDYRDSERVVSLCNFSLLFICFYLFVSSAADLLHDSFTRVFSNFFQIFNYSTITLWREFYFFFSYYLSK